MYFHDEHVIIKTDKNSLFFLAIEMKFDGIQFVATTATFSVLIGLYVDIVIYYMHIYILCIR